MEIRKPDKPILEEGQRPAQGSMPPARRPERSDDQQAFRWEILKQQYPALKDVDETNITEMAIALTQAVSEKLGIPMEGVTILGGNPYVNKTGLLYRVQNDPRALKSLTAVPIVLPFEMAAAYEGEKILFSKDGTCVFKGILKFQDGSEYSDIGTANAAYFTKQYNKMSSLVPYVVEMASTRAINRTIRMATGVALCSVEEINEHAPAPRQRSEQLEGRLDMLGKIADIEKKTIDSKLNFAQFSTIMKKAAPALKELQYADQAQLEAIEAELDRYIEKLKKPKPQIDYVKEIEKLEKELKLTVQQLDAIADKCRSKKTGVLSDRKLLTMLQSIKAGKTKPPKEKAEQGASK